jgi:hypothetical protein
MSRSTVLGGVWGLLFPFCSHIFIAARDRDPPRRSHAFGAAIHMSGNGVNQELRLSMAGTVLGLLDSADAREPSLCGGCQCHR